MEFVWFGLELLGAGILLYEASYIAIGLYASYVAHGPLPPGFLEQFITPAKWALSFLAVGYLGQIRDELARRPKNKG